MKRLTLTFVSIACLMGLAVGVSAQQSDQAIADAVIAMAKAQWTAEMKDRANIAEQMKNVADDYTEFNGDFATRIDGKAMNVRLGEAFIRDPNITVVAEMANPKVQVYNGDVAILTYNYVGMTKDKDGKVTPNRAKSTRVYVKKGNTWVLVHANFAADPLPN